MFSSLASFCYPKVCFREHCFAEVSLQLATVEKEEGIYISLLVARQFNGMVSVAN
jgi:hypothetical protein